MAPLKYDVYAIKYATSTRQKRDFFLMSDGHDGPAPIDYYIWVIRNDERVVVVDTGFDAARALSRRRAFIRCPTEGLRSLDISADEVETVILTHLHYDHCGNLDLFPRACFVLQDEEMRYATGRSMRFHPLRAPFELSDVLALVTHNYGGRVHFVSGSEEIAPGITVHHIPGHSLGLQCVTVETSRGQLCLASDAAHFYANIVLQNPFPIIVDVRLTLEGHDRVAKLADSLEHLVPGHDPLVATLFPSLPNDPLVTKVSAVPLRPITNVGLTSTHSTKGSHN